MLGCLSSHLPFIPFPPRPFPTPFPSLSLPFLSYLHSHLSHLLTTPLLNSIPFLPPLSSSTPLSLSLLPYPLHSPFRSHTFQSPLYPITSFPSPWLPSTRIPSIPTLLTSIPHLEPTPSTVPSTSHHSHFFSLSPDKAHPWR